MRKYRVLLFFALTLILAAVAFYLEKSDQGSTNQLHLNFHHHDIAHLTVTQKNETKIFVQKNQQWQIINSSIEADSDFMDSLAEKLSQASFDQVTLNDGTSQDQFRFDQPVAIIQWRNSGGAHRLTLSERKNFEGQTYYQLLENGKEYIVTGSSELASEICKPWIFYQKKHLFQKSFEDVKSIKIKSLNQQFTLVAPFKAPQKTDELLNKIRGLTVQEYFETQKPKFTFPLLHIEVLTSQGIWSMVLSLNAKDKKLYAEVTRQDGQKYAVEYSTSYWEYFANLSQKQFNPEIKENK